MLRVELQRKKRVKFQVVEIVSHETFGSMETRDACIIGAGERLPASRT